MTADPLLYDDLTTALAGTGIAVAAGEQAAIEAAQRPADLLVGAIVGAQGLKPTLAAIDEGTTVALANKECLVSAGDVFMQRAAAKGVSVIPVDSEHSAIFQCFETHNSDSVDKVRPERWR